MKIVQINSVCGVGSTGRIAVDLYKKYEEEGHECIIAYGRGKAPKNLNTIKIGNRLDFYIHTFLSRVTDRQGFYSKSATKKFIDKLKQIKPDVIHLHNIHGYYINIELLFEYLKKNNVSVVWTLHDCWALTGHCCYFDYVKCDKWMVECNNCPQKKSYPKSIFLDKSKSNYKKKKEIFTGVDDIKIITPSIWLKLLVLESYLRNYEVSVINNGVDINEFKPTNSHCLSDFGIVDKKIILGIANVWEERKGFNVFIQLSEKLSAEQTIILVGLSKKQIKKLPSNIIGIPKIESTEKLTDLYSSADLFLNPTREDNFPTTNIEALACGTPVLTFNTGGSIECVDENVGYILYNESINEVYDICNRILKSEENNYKYKCVEKARNKYDKEKQYKHYMEIIEELNENSTHTSIL